MRVSLVFTVWIFIKVSAARAAKVDLYRSDFLTLDLNSRRLHTGDLIHASAPVIRLLPRTSPPKHKEISPSRARSSTTPESERERRRVQFANPLVTHRANSPQPEPRSPDQTGMSSVGSASRNRDGPTRTSAPSVKVAAFVASRGRIRINTSPGLDPSKKETFTPVHDEVGRQGESRAAATASTEVGDARGTGDARASGNARVSASMSTGPNSTGCIDCRIPGQPPIDIQVKQNSHIKVSFDNGDPHRGQAGVIAKLTGIGKAKVRAYNY